MAEAQTKLSLDVWSDVVCPWCWIGKHRLELALRKTGLADKVQWRFHAFELGSRQQKPQPVLEHLAAKYGLSMEEAGQMTARVAGLGAELGLTMNMAGCISAPTYDAHRLLQWAQSLGQGPAMAEILHQTHFTRNLDVSDHGVLAAAAQEAGLDQALARGVLESQAFGKDVEQDLRRAADYEITGVPFTLIGGRWGVPGAQSVDVFAETLSKP